MNILSWIVISTLLVSAISFVGVITLFLKDKSLNKILLILVSLSAGALMGGAFLHLIPEALKEYINLSSFVYILVGFILFFLVEKIFHWQHCHKNKCPEHSFAYMNLLGDFIHNFIDGLIIAASFITNIQLGITTTLAVAMHEIPQEIGDFGILVYGGFKKSKALFLNFICALSAVIGGILGYFISNLLISINSPLLLCASGGFIYIAASDLVPEIKKEVSLKKSLINIGIFIFGILIMLILKIFF